MPRKSGPSGVDLNAFDRPGARVIDVRLEDESKASFGEYAYSVIHSRALPDVRDGLKPVHRRILHTMNEMGLRPERGYVKSARVVGDVMGNYHPHGDSAIYDAMVRLAQDFQLTTPLIDGKGAWGTPDDPAAAYRYTECRMSGTAMLMVSDIDEDTVDFRPNYDGSKSEPTVLPAMFPNLVVNGGSGIAVGMASNMIPHNLTEVIAATRWLVTHPNASLDKLMEFIPGPDLPTGGILLGMDQVRQAYETGRGVVRIRARAEVGPSQRHRGRQAITIVEFPYGAKPEAVLEAIREEQLGKLVTSGPKRGQRGEPGLPGVASADITTDMTTDGDQMVIECKAGVNPQALLADLYRLTPLETTFGINNNVLVNGTPQELGLKALLTEFLAHRFEVVTRRTRYRLRKAEERRHLVEGLLIALDNIDAVVKIIRSSPDTATAKQRLVDELAGVRVKLGGKFATRNLDLTQAQHIMDMPLRRLVSLEVDTLRAEWDDLTARISDLQAILDDESLLRKVVSDELAAVAKQFGQPRRTTLMDGDLKEVLAASVPTGPLEVADDPCQVLLSVTGLVARTAAVSEEATEAAARSGRAKHDAVLSSAHSTARGQVLLVTSRGRAFKTDVLTLPVLPQGPGTVSLRGGMSASELVDLHPGEKVVAVAPLTAPEGSLGLAMGTRHGSVKVTKPEWPVRSDDFDVIGLADGDEVVGAGWVSAADEQFVFVSSDAQVLRFNAGLVRPQGLSGGGMAGIKLSDGAQAVSFNVASTDISHGEPMVVVSTGTQVKVTPLSEYPAKGRATGGVASLRFLAKMNDRIEVAWVGPRPVGATSSGDPLGLPEPDQRRAGSGETMMGPDSVGHHLERS